MAGAERQTYREERCYKKVVELSLASFLSLARTQSNILHCSLHIYHIKREESEILSIEHKIYISWRRWGGLTLKIAGSDLSWELFHLQFLEFKHFLVFFVVLLRETKRNVGLDSVTTRLLRSSLSINYRMFSFPRLPSFTSNTGKDKIIRKENQIAFMYFSVRSAPFQVAYGMKHLCG